MTREELQIPQKQSKLGIILIFLKIVFEFGKRMWPLIFIFFAGEINWRRVAVIVAIILGLLLLGLIYSIVYYNRFLFHIDFDNRRFVLQKGVFSTKTLEISFNKIQQVDIKRSIFQRIIGVYSVIIDTAGSKKDEVQIQAISDLKAHVLSDILTKEIQNVSILDENEQKAEEIEQKPLVEWAHHLSILNLLKIGITESYLRGFLLVFVFLFSTFGQILEYFEDRFDALLEENQEYVETALQSVTVVISLVIGIFILSIIVTVARIIIKHFNLTIKQTTKRLEIEMGLKTNMKVSFQARRLQHLKIKTNPIQKKLNLYEAQMSLASSEDKLGKSKTIVPGLTLDLIQNILRFLYNKDFDTNQRVYRPHYRWLNLRFFVIFGILLAVLGIWWLEAEQIQWVGMSIFSAVFLGILIPYQFQIYKSIRLNVSNDFIIIKSGFWTQTEEIIELFKAQGVTVRQPFWYKKGKLVNLIFHTAGGDIRIRAIPEDFLTEINYLLYSVESSQKAWM